jgi:HEAT repeat protein
MAITGLLWRLLPDVRPGERVRFLFFVTLFGLVSLACTLGLAAVEALFLARVGPEQLPLTFILAAPVTVLGSVAYGAWVGRSRNDDLFVLMLVGAAVLVALGFAVSLRGDAWIYAALFCFYYLSFSVLRNHYWTFAVDYFDTLSSKRLSPLFNIGNSLGGALGGALAVLLSALVPAEYLIAGWALFLAAAAGLLRAGRRALRRWGPLELEETDESSLQGIGGAIRYSRRTPIGRWLIASTSGMILALIVGQYLYLSIFAASFDSAEALAAFFGTFLAITNLVEVGVEAWLLPRLIRRMGVGAANLVHPVLTLVSFGALAVHPVLASAIAARMNGELLENAMAAPLRSLVYNAVPLRFRGRIRALLEGIVWYAGMALAGGLLLVAVPRLPTSSLALLGGGTAFVYLVANWRVRRAYLDTMVARLREGRLDFAELGDELGKLGATRLRALWETLLHDADARWLASELGLARVLVEHNMVDAVSEGLEHADPRVRRACVAALGASADPEASHAIERALADPEHEVRLAAVLAVREQESDRRRELHDPTRAIALEQSLERLLVDPYPTVRAEAAAAAGEAGHATLRAMLETGAPDDVIEALRRLPRELLGAALDQASAEDPRLRAEALEAASRIAVPVPIPLGRLEEELGHSQAGVRRAALNALATHDHRDAQRAIARALADPSWELRRLAATTLARVATKSLDLVEPYLRAASLVSSEAAAQALASVGSPRARELLARELRRRVHEAWWAVLAVRATRSESRVGERFLHAALEDLAARDRVLCFRILELLEDAAVMRTVEKVLRFASSRARADALEVLSNVGDRESAALLVLMLEDGPVDVASVLRAAPDTGDPWIRMAASALLSDEGSDVRQEEHMDRLLVLRQVGLFAHLSLEQLETINRVLVEQRYMAGEEICREGDLGTELYILVDGEIEVLKNRGTPEEVLLATQRAPDYAGEMAILDHAPRSGSMVATTDLRLLSLSGEQLHEVILQTPEIAFELFRVLTRRVRRAEERLGPQLRQDPPEEPAG